MKRSERYLQYIHSQEWQEKRSQVFSERWYKCEKCGSEKNLHVHHWTYKRIFNEDLSDLFVFCNTCHDDFHKKYWTRDLLRATKAYIIWKEIIPRKKRIRKTKKERTILREARRNLNMSLYWKFFPMRWRTIISVQKILSKKFKRWNNL